MDDGVSDIVFIARCYKILGFNMLKVQFWRSICILTILIFATWLRRRERDRHRSRDG